MKVSNIIILSLGVLSAQIPADISSVPSGATVVINGTHIGPTPLSDYRIGTGKQKFELTLEGYSPAIKTIDIQSAKSVKIEFFLKKLYRINLKTDEKGLRFVFNKRDSLGGKENELVLEEGRHHLQVFRKEEPIDEKIMIIDLHKTVEYSVKKLPRNQGNAE